MIRCILVDDELDNLEVMQMLLQANCPQVQVDAVCKSAEEGIAAIKHYRPDLVFLDIEMPHMNGFDMLEQFEKLFFDVVFVTAYQQFAIRAFRYSALNYLLKPIDAEDLIETIRRVETTRTAPLKEQVEMLLQTVQNAGVQTIGRIALTTSYGMQFVETSEIIYCQSDNNYTTVKMADGRKIVVSKTMKEIDDTLAGPDFFRIHNSFLINLNHIKKFVRGEGGYVLMDDETMVSISRNKKQAFMELFSKF